jgi:hypothetical protein
MRLFKTRKPAWQTRGRFNYRIERNRTFICGIVRDGALLPVAPDRTLRIVALDAADMRTPVSLDIHPDGRVRASATRALITAASFAS